MFSGYGKISSAVIMKDDKGVSRGFGIVNFQSPDDAKKALEAMNGIQLGSKNLFVGRAQKKAERTKLLKHKYKDVFDRRFEKSKASNLYVKNLNVSIDDKRLQELFGRFGQITSARVMCHENGTRALFVWKFLYVAVAQRKEDRSKELQNYYGQNTPVQSSYQSSCKGATPQFHHPFYYNLPLHCCFPTPVPASLYQHPFVANVGYNSSVRIRDLDLINPGNKKVGFRKRENKRCKPTENSSVALEAIQFVTAATSPGYSNLSHLFVGNLKVCSLNSQQTSILGECFCLVSIALSNKFSISRPKHATKVSGQPQEMKTDAIKLLDCPNSLALEDKPIQVLKEANARTSTSTSTDAATFANLKSSCCLGY
ncbi:GDSL-like Lipase/Acylhydrolase superfamily protein [Hibiscus syriacus]|uniref:GDSL-like Lipase/Acylhydrolase superfamily protein n=1 Tax=Hibiscus syriacus TaxID=106335 RepID=A0A6A3CNZ2_HIBSY|nr:GDSL-like Lipase/Acylhydrolase superfamily protein [Hibiscus syriacus]